MFARVIGGESLAMTHLARPGHLLAPAEGFLGAYASALGDGMAGMVHGEALARFSIGWHRYAQPPHPSLSPKGQGCPGNENGLFCFDREPIAGRHARA